MSVLDELIEQLVEGGLSEFEAYVLLARFLEEEARIFVEATTL